MRFYHNQTSGKTSCITFIDNKEVTAFLGAHDGVNGMAAQFLMFYFLDIISMLHLIHYSLQTNNYDLGLDGLKKVLSFCFAPNKQKYARYGALSVNTLSQLEDTHPGCEDLLALTGISV